MDEKSLAQLLKSILKQRQEVENAEDRLAEIESGNPLHNDNSSKFNFETFTLYKDWKENLNRQNTVLESQKTALANSYKRLNDEIPEIFIGKKITCSWDGFGSYYVVKQQDGSFEINTFTNWHNL